MENIDQAQKEVKYYKQELERYENDFKSKQADLKRLQSEVQDIESKLRTAGDNYRRWVDKLEDAVKEEKSRASKEGGDKVRNSW